MAGSTIDSEMSSDFFGIELSADSTKGSVLYYTGLDTYDGSSHMLVGPTGLTFPDATTQTTAGYPNSNPSGFQTASDVSTYVTGLGYLTDAPSDGFAYNRKDGAWEIAGSGGSVAWGSIYGTVTDQTDLVTYVTGLGYQTASDVSTYVTANAYPLTGNPSGFLTSVPGKSVNNVDLNSADYTLVIGDANNIVNVQGDGSYSGYVIKIPDNSSVAFPIGTEVLFTNIGTGYNYINGVYGVTIVQTSNSMNPGYMRKAIKLDTDTWLISSQI
ncbi:MAG: hypothetical protein EBU33_03835 [Sphingobacteriia bacterium]|nr:hypothetical protein [Sphingobacteriia bacterium]